MDDFSCLDYMAAERAAAEIESLATKIQGCYVGPYWQEDVRRAAIAIRKQLGAIDKILEQSAERSFT